MGILSDLFRFREAGEPANRNNVEEFGAPARSLFTSTEIFTLHHRIEITDESGNVVYRAQTQFPSLHDKTDITDADGRQVAHIESKLFSLHERHFVDQTGRASSSPMSFSISSTTLPTLRDWVGSCGAISSHSTLDCTMKMTSSSRTSRRSSFPCTISTV